MASCAEGQSLREFLDELYEDYFDETTIVNLSSSATASASSATEFKTVSSEDHERLLSNTENKNTKRTTQTWVNRFNSWRVQGDSTELHEMSPEKLDKILRFYAELVKSNDTMNLSH